MLISVNTNRVPDDDRVFNLFQQWANPKHQDHRFYLILYATRIKKSNPIHQATAARMARATRSISDHLQNVTSSPVGPASLDYWATVQARQPDTAPVVRPDNEAFRQLNFIDGKAQRHQQEVAAASDAARHEYTRRIHVRLNGVSVPIELDIQEVWQSLGLSGYGLRPPYRDRVLAPTDEPHDMADVDLEEEDAEMDKMLKLKLAVVKENENEDKGF
ncbi:unnamed protein product [Phytophthora fragariaefolia]|uniref:Unnamed protein product n=1 Tax=Phytophthora fragariaefolia TaxID=1490495 RepID=A0A9W7CZN7_9STRA|nr:unnamed protein product [Phytophthora fragariaefolia]